MKQLKIFRRINRKFICKKWVIVPNYIQIQISTAFEDFEAQIVFDKERVTYSILLYKAGIFEVPILDIKNITSRKVIKTLSNKLDKY